jgi:hypothetical protein
MRFMYLCHTSIDPDTESVHTPLPLPPHLSPTIQSAGKDDKENGRR